MLPVLAYGVLTIAIETPVLLAGLASRHPWRDRLLAGVWLSACTWPVVTFLLPGIVHPEEQRVAYLAVAESFAVVAECLLFQAAFGAPPGARRTWPRDSAVILAANMISFGVGQLMTG